VPEARIRATIGGEVELDLSAADKEYAALMFPCGALFNSFDWQNRFLAHWNYAPEMTQLYAKFNAEIIQRFNQYQIPVITLTQQVSKEAVCHVFEKVNTGGVVLTAFELLTATYAADEFQLREDWLGPARGELLGIQPALHQHKVLAGVSSTDLLQAVTLLHTFEARQAAGQAGTAADKLPAVSCTGAAVLDLPLEAYRARRERVLRGFLRAGKFAREQHIFRARDLPYESQLVPLAAILAVLGDDWEGYGAKQKIRRWFWCGVLGELYGGATESRFARDVPDVLEWIAGGPEPRTVRDAAFNPGRLLTLRTRGSAAYKGIYALLMNRGGKDFRTASPITAQVFEDEAIDIHHIFPKRWCRDNKIIRKRMNCIINKTAISAKTNRIIGGAAPRKYLEKLGERYEIAPAALDDVLDTHAVSAALLRSDDFEGFFEARRQALLEVIAGAMGKPVAVSVPEPDDDETEDEEDVQDEVEDAAAA